MSAVVLRRGRFSVRVERRTLVFAAVAGLVVVGLALLGLCYGAVWASPAKVFAALSGDSGVVIRQWRLPRVLAGALFGAALGAAGAIFQGITGNPLGSPEVIGLDAGAYTGALVALTVLNGTSTQLVTGSVLGGLGAATAVYLLSRSGGLSGLRLVVIGISVNAMLTAVNSWIVLRAELEIAIAAVGWSAGSLNGLGWDDVRIPFAVLGVLLVVLASRSRAARQAGLGREVAVTTGVGLERLRLQLVLIGVGCTATVTAVAGPIAFIALSAPQIGRRLAGAPGVPMLPAALTGAVLLLVTDLLAQVLLAPVPLPAGVVSTAVGGSYLIWLLARKVGSR
ncbi:FecCD family ABC transporter permease [Actinokineospora globicatena]|uniref:FecCD family ABC transporter permease n=1 Tax=Actinokineospora globicatena TaxID=103729 RepID=UPI0020A416B8|nr:iron chelate uptake ABC transporter family permease subunit [Actinokineospora globicatena]MCP2303721.1 iron complex transport system permease protein [Actinokineospora globicatena]GLW79131.1 iron-enterobactin transporter permease [Actinokineospora globicatena]GLW86459.1 iron-enterobactin transporter permease [Actinokineospora globicatena]